MAPPLYSVEFFEKTQPVNTGLLLRFRIAPAYSGAVFFRNVQSVNVGLLLTLYTAPP
jgi:hypothetical protein